MWMKPKGILRRVYILHMYILNKEKLFFVEIGNKLSSFFQVQWITVLNTQKLNKINLRGSLTWTLQNLNSWWNLIVCGIFIALYFVVLGYGGI